MKPHRGSQLRGTQRDDGPRRPAAGMRLNLRHLAFLLPLAALAALVIVLLTRAGVTAPTAQAPSIPEAPIAVPALPAADPVPWESAVWRPIESAFAPNEAPLLRIDGLTGAGDAVIGWGRVPTPGRNQFNSMGAVFTSRDGESWRSTVLEHGVNAPSSAELRGVAAGPLGFLAYGSVCCDPEAHAVWHSTDATTWGRLEIEGGLDLSATSLVGAVALRDGWVAAGNATDGGFGGIWFSADARTWEPMLLEGDGLPGQIVSDVAVTRDGVIAVGTVTGPDGTYDGALWTSPNGREWERVAADDPALTGEDEVYLNAVVPHAGGLLVTGAFGSTEERVRCAQLGMLASTSMAVPETALTCAAAHERVWVSGDGVEWERIDPAEAIGLHPIEFRVIVAGGPGLVLLGETSAPASPDTNLFVSADGRTWSALRPPQPIGDGVAVGLVVRGRQVLAVADHSGVEGSELVVWIGSVP